MSSTTRQSARIGGSVPPLVVDLFGAVLSGRASLIPSRTAAFTTKYSNVKPPTQVMASQSHKCQVETLSMQSILSTAILAPVRPSASQESAPRPLRAPRAVKAQRATQSRPNWAQMALDFPSPPVRS